MMPAKSASQLKWASRWMFDSMSGKGLPGRAGHESRGAKALLAAGRITEGRDDIDKIPVEPETRSYARMTSKDVMDQPGGTSNKWRKSLALRKAVTNQRHIGKGFPDQDKGQSTSGGKIGERLTPPEIVSRMID